MRLKKRLFLFLFLILFFFNLTPKRSIAGVIEVLKKKEDSKESVKRNHRFVSKNAKANRPGQNDKKKSFSELDEVKSLDKDSAEEIKKFLSKNSVGVWDFTNRYDIKTGTAIRGILLNSIVSSNLESPLLVETSENYEGIPSGSKFSCIGATKNKRVLAVCNKLITDSDEYEVDVMLLNNDGTAGLLGKAYSGKEQYAVGAITGAALKGALDVSLDRVSNSFGTETVRANARNKMKGGGIGALDEIVQMSTDEYKNQEPKISIDAGKEILIYFNRRFKL